MWAALQTLLHSRRRKLTSTVSPVENVGASTSLPYSSATALKGLKRANDTAATSAVFSNRFVFAFKRVEILSCSCEPFGEKATEELTAPITRTGKNFIVTSEMFNRFRLFERKVSFLFLCFVVILERGVLLCFERQQLL